jgi:transposase-like protein
LHGTLAFRFRPSLPHIEELLFERGVIVSYETVRRGCGKFGAGFAHRVKAVRRRPGTTWHLGTPSIFMVSNSISCYTAPRQGCSEVVFQARACLVR